MTRPNLRSFEGIGAVVRSNYLSQRTVMHGGRAVLAIGGVLGGAEWAAGPAAEQKR